MPLFLVKLFIKIRFRSPVLHHDHPRQQISYLNHLIGLALLERFQMMEIHVSFQAPANEDWDWRPASILDLCPETKVTISMSFNIPSTDFVRTSFADGTVSTASLKETLLTFVRFGISVFSVKSLRTGTFYLLDVLSNIVVSIDVSEGTLEVKNLRVVPVLSKRFPMEDLWW